MPNPALNKVLQERNAENRRAYSLTADWVQLHCQINDPLPTETAGIVMERKGFKIARIGQSKTFRDIYSIHNESGKMVASWATNANACIMREGHGLLKLDNWTLYFFRDCLPDFVRTLLDFLGMRFIGISRLDIAYDFHEFMNARCPANFIRDFACGKILQDGKTKAKGTWEEIDGTSRFDWLSLGKGTSLVTTKLYNKTKELKDATDKPYIRDTWQNTFLDTQKTIWRLEFSIKANTLTLRTHDNEEIDFHSLRILDRFKLEQLWCYMLYTKFRFKYNDGKSRKDRMRHVALLDFEHSNEIPLNFRQIKSVTEDSSRSTIIMLNKLNSVYDEIRERDAELSDSIKAITTKLVAVHALEEKALRKGWAFDSSDYAKHLQELADYETDEFLQRVKEMKEFSQKTKTT